MPTRFLSRIQKAQQMMADMELDILFVNNRENLIYFTGLTQIECLAVLIPRTGEACAVTLWLDADYVQKESGLKTYGYHFPSSNLAEKCIERMRTFGYTSPRVGFERYFVGFAVYDSLRQTFPEQRFTNASDLFYRLRSVKDDGEVELMRQAGRIVDVGMAAAMKAVRAGIRETEVLAEAEYAMLKAGSGGVPFCPQVVSGERALLTHPCAGDKIIQDKEIVVIHLGATHGGYCAKMCRTAMVGAAAPAYRETHDLLLRAQEAAINALRPGVTAAQVDAVARAVIQEAGLERCFLDVVGYGVGIRQSEFYPIIGKGLPHVIQENMVVDLLLPTVYKPGLGGPRVTDIIRVEADGARFMTDFDQKPIRK